MSFVEHIDFSNYGIQFDYSPDSYMLPESIKENILPVLRERNRNGSGFVKFTKKDGSEINMKLIRELGKGSYGAAWSTDTEIDKGVKLIVKIIGSSHIKTNVGLANYEYDIIQETIAQIIIYESTKDIILSDINLRGPFAPKLFFIGKDANNFYIVSERLDSNVNDFLKKIPTSDFIKTTIVQLSKILEILYEKIKFNHRDLKPDNIMFKMINDKINVRLIDFGFSCLKYRNLNISAVSKDVYASTLHCNSKIRDMHSFLYFLVYYTAYTDVRCPIKRLINALISSSNVRTPRNWGNTYASFDKYNSEGESGAALNCAYDVVHNIFLSIKFGSDDSCSNINADWTRYLVFLNLDTTKFLRDEEYKNIRPEVLEPFFKSINSPRDIFLASDQYDETILHKIVKNKDDPNADKYLDHILSVIDNNTDIINMHSLIDGKTAFDISINNNYKYAQEKLIMYVNIKNGLIKLNMLDLILEPDNKYFDNNQNAIPIILYNIIKSNESTHNERIEKIISKIGLNNLKQIMFDNDIVREKKSYTVLDMSIFFNNTYILRKLLQYDLQVNKNMLLFNIVFLKDEDLITIVLDKYMDVSFINDFNKVLNATPLINAVKNTNLILVKKLVNVPNIKYSKQDYNGNTCLHSASILASSTYGEKKQIAFEIIKVLLDKYPALADIKNKDGMGPGNPNLATDPAIRTFIKERKSTLFRKNPNTEKNTTRVGGRLRRKKKRTTLKRR